MTRTSSSLRRPASLAVTFIMVLGLMTGLASPASAAVTIALTASNGVVGVPQTLTATVSTTDLGSPTGTISFTVNGQAIGSQSVGGTLGSKADVTWTPSAAGSATVAASFAGSDGSQATDSRVVQVVRAGTTTTIQVPGSAGTSSAVTLTATVTSTLSQYVPTGKVTFLLSGGTVLGSSSLDGAGRAAFGYTTPATTGTVRIYASYGGDGNANASTSSTASISVAAKSSSVTLTLPQPAYVGSQVPLTAKVSPTSASGTVDFAVNGQVIGTVRLANASASVIWVPVATGTATVTARYSGGTGLNASSDSVRVQVSAQLKADQITLDPTGSAGAWPPGGSITLANGTSVALDVRSLSGQNVRLAITGPCALEGNTVAVRGVGGTCTLTASTNGGNGYAPVTQKYYIATVAGAQTAKVLAPASGTYRKGTVLKLSRLTTVTNVSQPVRWKVTKGAATCRVVASGTSYKLQLRQRGTCRVRGYAPPIADQWKAFSTYRTYRVT